ncbi:SEC-C metal-binding domain-containing protein [Aeromonas rivipollensis]|uniref:SEC-C metal-binding domain-containing protein n=1 Tax=Aeromonas rivipollensis TaxID=948519 RepID=UPI003D199C1A
MPNIPAICDDCGTMFPSGIFMENCTNIRLSGNKSGPCPSCGGWGSIPDGVFNVLGSVIEIIDAPRKTLEQLGRYVRVINKARDNKLTREEFKEQIEKDVPELACISDILPKTRNELYAFLGLLLTALAIMISLMKDDETVVIEPQIILEQTINNYNFGPQSTTSSVAKPDRGYLGDRSFKQKVKVGRNEPCPCGSELKYKKCCLNMI